MENKIMANKIIGRFYFKLTDSKNLIGEFSNNACARNYTESADRISENAENNKFIGDFLSTWHEENEHRSVLAKLKIEPKPNAQNIFSLAWWLIQDNGQSNTNPTFWGEGILCDGILIGNYWNEAIKNFIIAD